jgi:hypothetical protein
VHSLIHSRFGSFQGPAQQCSPALHLVSIYRRGACS